MSEQPFTTIGDEALEARIVAWVLGEASAFEIAELERLCAERPELLIFQRRMKALHGLVSEAEAPQEVGQWKLPPAKRAAVEQIFNDGKPLRLDVTKESRIRFSARRAILSIAACFVITVVVWQLMPRQAYVSQAVLEIRPSRPPMSPLGPAMGERAGASAPTAQFFGTEFEKIKSRESLGKVVDNLNLAERWGTDKEQAVNELKKRVETENIRGTDLMAIRVKDRDKDMADEIAREVTFSYQRHRDELEAHQAEEQLKALNKVVREQEDRVEERRKVLATIAKTKSIIYAGETDAALDGNGKVAANQSGGEKIRRGLDAQDYADARREFETEQKLLEEIKIKAMGETIARKIPSSSVEIHELPGSKTKSKSSTLLASKEESLRTQIPAERIEGTPMPMVLPGQTPSKGRARQNESLAKNAEDSLKSPITAAPPPASDAPADALASLERKVQTSVDKKPSAPSSSMSKTIASNGTANTIPVPDVDVTTPSLDFGGGDAFGKGWGDASGGASGGSAGEAVAQGNRSGDGVVTRKSIDAVLNNPQSDGREANKPLGMESAFARPGEEDGLARRRGGEGAVDKQKAEYWAANESAKAPVDPAIANGVDSFASAEKMPSAATATTSGTLSLGANSYAGLAQLSAGTLTLEEGKKQSQNESSDEDATGDPYWDTSGVAQSGKSAKPGTSYEIHTGYTSEYLFRGIDLGVANELDAPARANPALTDEHTQNVDQVRRNLYKAEGNYNLGKYDDAKREYEDALRTDPYNSAARRGLERLAQTKSDYYRAAYDHTRAELLTEVDSAWELEVPGESKVTNEKHIVGFAGHDSPIAADVDKALEMNEHKEEAKSSSSLAQREMVRRQSSLAEAQRLLMDARKSYAAGDYQKAYETYEQSLNQIPDVPSNQALQERRNFLRKSLGDAAVALSMAAKKVGQHESARQWRDKARAWDPSNPQASDELAVEVAAEIPASEEPYSTFSLNISDTSFRIAQAALAKGERPDPAGIKVEQFYNAVNYGDPAPAAGQPVACLIEQSAHPVIPGRNLVRVALKTAAAGRSAAQPLRLTLLVDQSGSMSRADRSAAMDAAMRSLGTLLTDKDLVTVIGFSRKPRLLADGLKGSEIAPQLAGLVNQASSEGGTNLEQAIKLAEEKSLSHKLVGAQNRIVLFTDGAANLGDADPQRLAAKVEQLRQQGISFDIAGIAADDLNDELLAELARKGNGRYSVVGKGEEKDFAKQLAGAFRPAAENVKVQVHFNPERVARYKLIGFEKDRLKTEDFRNDAVDAAELAAEEAGVAIYQVEPIADGRGEIGEVSVRFRDTSSGEMVERMWTMTHNASSTAVDRAAPSMQLAVLALLAGEKLKGGPLADAIDFKQFADSQATVKQAFANDTRIADMLRMMDALK